MQKGSQFCTTDIIHPLKYEDRNKPSRIFIITVIVSATLYYINNVSIAYYFKDNTLSPCTLLWSHFSDSYNNQTSKQENNSFVVFISSIVAWFIVLFPALDVSSAYPLNAITLANTIESAIFNKQYLIENQTWISKIIKISICVICTLLSLFIWNFQEILAYSGFYS